MAVKKQTSPVYILHGWTKNSSKWNPCVNWLKKAGLHPILLKIPGLTSKLPETWTLDDYVNWFSHQVEGNNLTLIAHSFGGRIAIRFSVKNPGRVKKLILIDSAGIRPGSLAARFKRISFWTLAKIGKQITQNPGARKLLYSFAREKDYYDADSALAQTMVNVIQDDQKEEIPFVKAHTLIIWGSLDTTTPLSHGRYMNRHITGSTLKIVDGAGHSPQYTHCPEVSTYITQFLKTSK